MSKAVEILKKAREFIVNNHPTYLCHAITYAATFFDIGSNEPLVVNLRAEVIEMIDGAFTVEAWLNVPKASPITKQYRLAILDVLIACHSK